MAVFLEFKALYLFSLTFGIGVAVQAERAKLRDIHVEAFLVRRFLVLLAFGACHMLLVSKVDILALYAVCGLMVIPLLRLPVLVLALAGLAAVYLPAVFPLGPMLPPESVLRAHAVTATRIYSQGGFGDILVFRWRETRQLIAPLLITSAQRTWGLMLLGVAVWRAGVVREPQRYRFPLCAVCLGAGVIGLVNTIGGMWPEFTERPVKAPPVLDALGSRVPLAFAYAAGLLAWRRSERSAALTAAVAAAGRMALTNYLAQSLLFSVLFYGYGFGLFGRIPSVPAARLSAASFTSGNSRSACGGCGDIDSDRSNGCGAR